jgi:hypothetical protein
VSTVRERNDEVTPDTLWKGPTMMDHDVDTVRVVLPLMEVVILESLAVVQAAPKRCEVILDLDDFRAPRSPKQGTGPETKRKDATLLNWSSNERESRPTTYAGIRLNHGKSLRGRREVAWD